MSRRSQPFSTPTSTAKRSYISLPGGRTILTRSLRSSRTRAAASSDGKRNSSRTTKDTLHDVKVCPEMRLPLASHLRVLTTFVGISWTDADWGYSNINGHQVRMPRSLSRPRVETVGKQGRNRMQNRRGDGRSLSREHESANALVMGQEQRKPNEVDENRDIGNRQHHHMLRQGNRTDRTQYSVIAKCQRLDPKAMLSKTLDEQNEKPRGSGKCPNLHRSCGSNHANQLT